VSQSFIAWIDASDEEGLPFKEHDTRDELGVASIRNAFADLFFPGTNTLMTRARYFLFVPWLYLHLESRLVPSAEIDGYLKEGEVRLMEALKRAGQEGVIGQVAGAGLRRFPSSIYWTGLRRWGILRQSGTRRRYMRSLDSFYLRRQHRLTSDDGQPVAGWAETNWDPALPPAPPRFPNVAAFDLEPDEPAYLRERVLASCRGSLLAALLDPETDAGQGGPLRQVSQLWLAPGLDALPREQQRWIGHARRFSLAMYGAVLLYNRMLAELLGSEELAAAHGARLARWQADVEEQAGDLRAWNLDDFWQLVKSIGRVPWPAERFCRDWLDLLLGGPTWPDIIAGERARALVRARETALKGTRSRFESPRHLEVWGGAAGLAPLDYRWAVARVLIDDIRSTAED
jgi:hypothetical protein